MSKKSLESPSRLQSLWVILSIGIPIVLGIILFLDIPAIYLGPISVVVAILTFGAIIMNISFISILHKWLKLIPIVSLVSCLAVLALAVFYSTWF